MLERKPHDSALRERFSAFIGMCTGIHMWQDSFLSLLPRLAIRLMDIQLFIQAGVTFLMDSGMPDTFLQVDNIIQQIASKGGFSCSLKEHL